MEIFVARQPILDRGLNLHGYELLYRSCRKNACDCADGDLASMQVLANTVLTFGPETLLNGKLGFVNFTRNLLVGDLALLMPPNSLVVEILESVKPDHTVIEACRKLKSKGYQLALDDFSLNHSTQPLVELANILKVDFRATTKLERSRIVERYGRSGLRILAEKVETQEEFAWARQEGFSYFQGFFFAHPLILARKSIPSFKFNLLRILAEIHDPDFDFGRLERLIKQEVPLCYHLLRYVNSAAFGARSPVTSIHGALVYLGEETMRRWIGLAALPVLASDKPGELVVTALLRARFCELIAPWAGLSSRRSDLFLAGMFSLLDAMVGRPLGELVGELNLAWDVRAALVGDLAADSAFKKAYRLVLDFERSDWEAVTGTADGLGIPAGVVSDLYVEAAGWCEEIFHAPVPARSGLPRASGKKLRTPAGAASAQSIPSLPPFN